MNSFGGAYRALEAKERGDEFRVFDWNKAAQIIADRGILHADAGLSEDMMATAVTILVDGEPSEDFGEGHLASLWATPVLAFFPGDDPEQPEEEVECWLPASATPGWSENTRWPESALALLRKRPRVIEGEVN